MRLYSLAEATTVVHDGTVYTPADDGGFDFPGPLSDRMHAVHVNGRRQWETAIERQRRVIAEELAIRQSPEALHDAVRRLPELLAAAVAGAFPPAAPAAEPEAPKAPPKAAPARPAAAKAGE